MQHNKMNFILLTINLLITQMQLDKISQLFFPKLYFQFNYKVITFFKNDN